MGELSKGLEMGMTGAQEQEVHGEEEMLVAGNTGALATKVNEDFILESLGAREDAEQGASSC